MDALGYYGQQLNEHVSAAAQKANEKIEQSLFDIGQFNLNEDEKVIFNSLDKEPSHIEQILIDTDLSPGNVNAGLISLRLKGLIKQLPGSLFVRR